MSDNVTTALQVNATTGNGETLVLHQPRLVTFKITGNGPVSAWSHDAVMRIYDESGNVIETHEHKGDFKNRTYSH